MFVSINPDFSWCDANFLKISPGVNVGEPRTKIEAPRTTNDWRPQNL
jgi:hypothetical protein